jgi:predicted nucleic acid-binding protein
MKGHTAVQANLRVHLNDPLNICTVTLMELYYGAYKSQEVTSNLAKIKTIENSLDILSVGTECVEVFGSLKANLEKTGSSVDDFDLIIASRPCHEQHKTLQEDNGPKADQLGGLPGEVMFLAESFSVDLPLVARIVRVTPNRKDRVSPQYHP